MKASTVTKTGRAKTHPLAPPQHPLLIATSQMTATRSSDNLDAENITLRATAITIVLKDILEHDGYRHGGLNE